MVSLANSLLQETNSPDGSHFLVSATTTTSSSFPEDVDGQTDVMFQWWLEARGCRFHPQHDRAHMILRSWLVESVHDARPNLKALLRVMDGTIPCLQQEIVDFVLTPMDMECRMMRQWVVYELCIREEAAKTGSREGGCSAGHWFPGCFLPPCCPSCCPSCCAEYFMK